MAKSQPTSIRLEPEIKAALAAKAEREGFTLSGWINTILRERLRSDGYLPPLVEAEAFVEVADLTEYDPSGFAWVDFERRG